LSQNHSPIDGIVLRKHHRSGESVSNSSTVPDPILTLGDRKALRVRVDVDETDVSKVRMGQKAYVTADAYGKQKFWGRVVRVGQQLAGKTYAPTSPRKKWTPRFSRPSWNLIPARNCLTACAWTRLSCRRAENLLRPMQGT
jgi:multidrug resistance efflux pump